MVNGRLSSRLILFRLLLPYQKSAETILPRVLFLFRRHSALALTQVLRFTLPPSHIRSRWSHLPLLIQRCRFIPRMLPQVNNRRFRIHQHRNLQAHLRPNSYYGRKCERIRDRRLQSDIAFPTIAEGSLDGGRNRLIGRARSQTNYAFQDRRSSQP